MINFLVASKLMTKLTYTKTYMSKRWKRNKVITKSRNSKILSIKNVKLKE